MKAITTSFLFLFINIFFSNTCISCAQQKTDSTYHYYQLLNKPNNSEDLAKAYLYFDNSKEQNIINNNFIEAISDLRYIAEIQKRLGLINESENSAVEALKLLDILERNDTIIEPRIGIYNHLGMIYSQRKDFKKALEYYNKVLEISKEPKHKNSVFNNRAIVYTKNEEYELAVEELFKVYSFNIEIGDKQKIARALDNLGFSQSKINDPQSLSNLTRALEIRKEIGYSNGVFTSYLHLSEYYKDRNEIEKSIDFVNKAYAISIATNNIKQKEAALELKLKLKDDPDYKEYTKIKDSISDFQRLSMGKYAALKYEKTKEILRANVAELKNQKLKTRNILWITLASSIVLLSVFLYFLLKSKHKKDKIKEAYRKETELSKKVHDELANDMSDLMNFVENDIEVAQAKKSLLMDNIEDIYLRTRDISTETGSIDLVNFSDSIKHLLMQHNKPETKVVTNNVNTIDWQNLAEYKKVVIYRCLQELLVNMKKHSNAKVVSIMFKNHNKNNEIRYVDDGLGFSIDKTKLNGLSNVESRIKGIGGNFNFTTSKGNGFKATLEFNS